jgi:hypothetical protein
MPREDVERFGVAAGDLLDGLGYPRAVPHPRPESLEHASKIRALLARDPKWIDYSGARGAKEANESFVA